MVEAKKKGCAMALTAEERDNKFRETLWRLVDQSGRSERKICEQLGITAGISISSLTAMQIRHTRAF